MLGKWFVNYFLIWLIYWVIDKILTNSKTTADPTKFPSTKQMAHKVVCVATVLAYITKIQSFLSWCLWTSRALYMPWDGRENHMCALTCAFEGEERTPSVENHRSSQTIWKQKWEGGKANGNKQLKMLVELVRVGGKTNGQGNCRLRASPALSALTNPLV